MSETSCTMKTWLAEPMDSEVKRALERVGRSPDVLHIAVMPDVHLAEQVCVGVAMATRREIYPDAVGGDIGCGMATIALNATADALRGEGAAARLLEMLRRCVPVNRRHVALDDALRPESLSDPALVRLAERDGRVQFGTLGRGNHFVEFQSDGDTRLWVLVHSGSRAMGPAIRQFHVRRGASNGRLASVASDSPAGLAYLADMEWAAAYAKASRRALLAAACDAAERAIDAAADEMTYLDCCHNFVRREQHLGHKCWVHRKGSIGAAPDEPGIVPGSMGAATFHVAGRGCDEALCSASHGAGRRFSRSAARARISVRDMLRDLKDVWFDEALSDALREESPKAYRDIRKVMRAQGDLVRVTRTLRPALSFKGV